MIIVIGRGSSGTRLASKLFSESGIYMGHCNASGDLIPPEAMYKAARLAGACVRRLGHHNWDFSGLIRSNPPDEYRKHIERYLASVLGKPDTGFKIPEALLSFPWLSKMFPDAHYLYWTRDARDVVTRSHITDDLPRFGVPSEYTNRRDNITPRRTESYVYQRMLVEASPKPKLFLHVHYEDFVLDHQRTVEKISEFVGRKLLEQHETLNRSKISKEVLERFTAPDRYA